MAPFFVLWPEQAPPAIPDCFAYVTGLDGFTVVEISDGSSHPQDLMVTPGTEFELLDRIQ